VIATIYAQPNPDKPELKLVEPDLGMEDGFGLVPPGFTSFVSLIVPSGYKSNKLLAGSSLYEDATFDSLGMIPGEYTWTWGSGTRRTRSR
jgi:hypothetical protein